MAYIINMFFWDKNILLNNEIYFLITHIVFYHFLYDSSFGSGSLLRNQLNIDYSEYRKNIIEDYVYTCKKFDIEYSFNS